MMLMRRLLEACLALLISIVCCSSTRLQAALRFSADHLRQLTAVLNNPRFVFLIGNAIVLAIALMPRCLSSSPDPESAGTNNLHHLSGSDDDAESYEEVEENLHGNSAGAAFESDIEVVVQQQQQQTPFVSTGCSPHVPAEVVAGEAAGKTNKQQVVVLVEASATSRVITTSELRVGRDGDRIREGSLQSMECGCDVDETGPADHHGQLRRSEVRYDWDWDWDWDEQSRRYAMEELSSEEFRLAVEAFINKNRSLMKRESATTAMAVLCD